jgi:hypothetical protein
MRRMRGGFVMGNLAGIGEDRSAGTGFGMIVESAMVLYPTVCTLASCGIGFDILTLGEEFNALLELGRVGRPRDVEIVKHAGILA